MSESKNAATAQEHRAKMPHISILQEDSALENFKAA
jgi:hypothetical protein